MSKLFQELCAFLGVKHSPTVAYRPQANAENERSHKDLHQYLAMYLNESSAEDWNLLLSQAAWVHNSLPHTTLGMSPFEVVTGLTPNIADALVPALQNEKLEAQVRKDGIASAKFFGANPEKLEELRELAKEAIARSQAKTLERLNVNARFPDYHIGDKVLRRTHAQRRFAQRKWNDKFDGPWTIIHVISPTVMQIELDSQPGHKDIVHATYLKKYHKRTDADTTPSQVPDETALQNSVANEVESEYDYDNEDEAPAQFDPGHAQQLNPRYSSTETSATDSRSSSTWDPVRSLVNTPRGSHSSTEASSGLNSPGSPEVLVPVSRPPLTRVAKTKAAEAIRKIFKKN